MEKKVEKLIENLKKKRYEVEYFDTAAEAAKAVLGYIGTGRTVGIGGSVTVQDMGLYEKLQENGCTVSWHWKDGKKETRDKALASEYYLASANAITESGNIFNIDGNGNRVASMVYGPGTTILLIGINKIAADDEAAIARVKNVACPKNAVRLGLDTPCAKLGRCIDCASPSRMCNVLVGLYGRPGGKDIRIILIGEEAGY